MYNDFKELLSGFNAHGVRYLVIGGYAVSYHAQPRATGDIDLFVSTDLDNAAAIFGALTQFGAPLQGLRVVDFIDPDSFFRMGAPPMMVDILPKIDGLSFDSAWPNRVMVEIESGLNVPYISRDDLVTAKIAAARPRDLADVDALRAARNHTGNS